MRKILLLCVGLGVLFATSAHVRAAGGTGLTISPVLQDVTVDALGTGVDSYFTLSNTTTVPETLRLTAVDFDALSDQAGIVFLGMDGQGLDKSYRLASWMHLSKDRVILNPGASEKITVRIENDQSLTPGGHYGAVLATTSEADSGTDDGVSFRQALSSLFFVKKTGGERYDLSALDVSTDASWYKLPSTVSVRFRNGGNVHVVPRGIIELRNSGGDVLARQAMNVDSAILLPEHIRTLQSTLTSSSWWRLPGLYSVDVSYRFDGQDAFAKVSVSSFYAGSPAFLAAALCSLAIIILLYLRILHAKRTRQSSP